MNIWFCSDLHLGHSNIIKYTNRPFETIEEMNNILIDNWNKVVKNNDKVYFLGDFAFGKIEKYYHRLKGNIEFIKGNHDKQLVKFIGRENISTIKEISIYNTNITLCHYAMRTWNKSHYGSYHLYGHSHDIMPPLGRSIDVGVDSHWVTGKKEYRPFNFDEINIILGKQNATTR